MFERVLPRTGEIVKVLGAAYVEFEQARRAAARNPLITVRENASSGGAPADPYDSWDLDSAVASRYVPNRSPVYRWSGGAMKPSNMPALVDEGLGRTDYFAYWKAQAHTHARENRWRANVDDVSEALCAAFTREWLETEARRPERLPLVGTPGKHPLGQMVALTSAANAARVLELGIYLRRCADIASFAEVVANLRTAQQFEGARLQLGLGYRFRRVRCTNVLFEPDAERNRRADIAFDYQGEAYLVECYAPVAPHYGEYDLLLSKGLNVIFDAAAKREKRVVVRIALESAANVDLDMRRRIEATFIRLLAQLQSRSMQRTDETGFTMELFDTSGVEARQVRDLAWSFQDWERGSSRKNWCSPVSSLTCTGPGSSTRCPGPGSLSRAATWVRS